MRLLDSQLLKALLFMLKRQETRKLLKTNLIQKVAGIYFKFLKIKNTKLFRANFQYFKSFLTILKQVKFLRDRQQKLK